MDIERLQANFEILPDWTERYRFIIDLGRHLEDFPTGDKTEVNRVHGCVSQVWLTAELSQQATPTLQFAADSDAHIVRGLIAILMIIFSDKSPEAVLAVDAEAILNGLGLERHLSPSRSNGLFSMVGRIRELAQSHV